MTDNTQMLKGILEGVMLKIIEMETCYGYEIAQKLMDYGFNEVSEGTIYPLLLRLEKSGRLDIEKRESPVGPNRKYYSLSKLGKQDLIAFQQSWSKLKINVDSVLQEKEKFNLKKEVL